MNKKKGVFFTGVMVVLTVVTLWVMGRSISGEQLAQAIAEARLRWLAAGFFLMLSYVALEGVCIRMTMGAMGQKPGLGDSIRYAFVGFYFSGITPSASGGQPVQVYCMGRDRLSLPRAALCLLLISSIYQISMLLYGGGVFLLQRGFLGNAIAPVGWLLTLGAGLNLLLVAAILIMMFSPDLMERLVMGLGSLLGRLPGLADKAELLKGKIRQLKGDYRTGAEYIKKNPGLVLRLFAITLARLTILYLMPYFVAKAFGVSGHTAFQMIGLQAMLTLAVSSLPFPGAVGISEGVSLLLFGIMFSAGLLIPAMLLVRVISFYGVLCVSLLFLGADFLFRKGQPAPCR